MAAEVKIIIKTFDESTKQTKEINKGFKQFAKELLLSGAAIATVGIALKKAFDLGKEGARITQLGNAAASLGVDLESLRAASNNTVTDFALLNAQQTLLIGTQGELKDALLDSSARLLEIAKAANTVNPALGDTGHLFQSLAAGIKRSSPLLIDNVGLIVKVGEANENYAESLGKTVGELSAQDKQMALLNATLDAGNVLIEQAAEVADGGVDSFNKLSVAITNAADSIKKDFGEAFGGAAEALADFINAEVKEADVTEKLTELWKAGRITLEELNEATEFGFRINEEYAQSLFDNAKAMDGLRTGTEEVIPELEEQFLLMDVGADHTETLAENMRDLAKSESAVSIKAQEAKNSMLEFFEAADPAKLSVFGDALDDLDFARAGGGEVQQFAEDFEAAIEAGTVGVREIEEGAKAGFVATQALNVELGDTTAAEAAAAVMEELSVGPAEALALVSDLQGALDRLHDVDLTITITKLITGSSGGIGVGFAGVDGAPSSETLVTEAGKATGGSFLIPGSGGTDSQFVGFMGTPGEEVSVATPGQQGSEDRSGVINNFNGPVTISSDDTELLLQMGLDVSGARVP